MNKKILLSLITILFILSACGPVETAQDQKPGQTSVTQASTPTLAPTFTPTRPSLPMWAGTPVPASIDVINPVNAARVVELARWGNQINDIAFSPDGKMLTSATDLGIFLYAADTLELLRQIDPQTAVYSVAFSPDGKTLVSGRDQAVNFWDVTTWQKQRTLSEGLGGNNITSLSFFPDGKKIMVYSLKDGRGYIKILDVESENISTLDTSNRKNFTLSPDGKIIATAPPKKSASDPGEIDLFDAVSGKPLSSLKPLPTLSKNLNNKNEAFDFTSVAFSPDGKILAAGSEDGEIRLWDVASGNELHALSGQKWPVNGLSFSPDGKTLASASDDGTVQLWDMASGKALNTLAVSSTPAFGSLGENEINFPPHVKMPDAVHKVAFSPDGKSLVSTSGANHFYPSTFNNTIQLWDVATGQELHSLDGPMEVSNSLVLSSDGKTLASGMGGRPVKLWDVPSGKLLHTLVQDGKIDYCVEQIRLIQVNLPCMSLSPDGKILVTRYDGTLTLWDTGSGQVVRTLNENIKAKNEGENYVTFSPDGKILVSSHFHGTIGSLTVTEEIWDVTSGKKLFTLSDTQSACYQDVINLVESRGAFSPDGKIFAVASHCGNIKLWNIDTGKLIGKLGGSNIFSLVFSPDGKKLVTGSLDESDVFNLVYVIRVLDATTGEELTNIKGGKGFKMASVALSPDGNLIAAGSEDGKIRLWDAATGNELTTLYGHKNEVKSVNFSPDGKTLISGANDGTIRIWGLASADFNPPPTPPATSTPWPTSAPEPTATPKP